MFVIFVDFDIWIWILWKTGPYTWMARAKVSGQKWNAWFLYVTEKQVSAWRRDYNEQYPYWHPIADNNGADMHQSLLTWIRRILCIFEHYMLWRCTLENFCNILYKRILFRFYRRILFVTIDSKVNLLWGQAMDSNYIPSRWWYRNIPVRAELHILNIERCSPFHIFACSGNILWIWDSSTI